MIGALIDNKNINILRYALGSTITVAVVMGFGLPIGYLVPVLSLSFLASGKPAPDLKGGLMFFLIVTFSASFGLLLAKFFLPFPVVHILLLTLILFYIFFTNHPLFHPLLKTFLLISILLIPNLALFSKDKAIIAAISLSSYAAITILLIWFIFLLFPAQKVPESVAEASPELSPPTRLQRFNTAITSTLVILPVLLLFYFYNFTDSILILIFISILSMQPEFAKDFKGGKALVLGNLIGGLSAILAYEIFTVLPEFFYFVLVVLLAGLIFGRQVFSGKPMAALWGMGFSTFLLVICSTTAMGTTDADAKVWTRVLQIMTAVIYIVGAFGLISLFKNDIKSKAV
jgi:hypothetical protein